MVFSTPIRMTAVIATLGPGGAEATMTRLTSQLAVQGHQIYLVTLSNPESDFHTVPDGVTRISLESMGDSGSLWQGLRANLKRLWALRQTIKRTRPQVVLSFVDGTNILALIALAGTGIPVVVSERIDPRHYPIGRIRTLLRPFLYRWFARAVVVQTQSVAQWAAEFLKPKQIWVIPNAVPPDFMVGVGHTEPLPTDFPLVHGQTVLAMGRLDRQKGFDVLLAAWGQVAGAHADWNLVILGDGPERAPLESQAASLPRVSLPGKITQPVRVLARGGIFVLSSRFEGFPNALLEAMAVGLPAISTDCPSGPADIITHNENGLLLPVEDPAALADALCNLMADPQMRERLATAGKESLGRVHPSKVVPLWEACLRGLHPPQI